MYMEREEIIRQDSTVSNKVGGDKNDQSSSTGSTVIKDVTHLINHMEMMHDKRIVKNLQAAGLSNVGFDEGDEILYSKIEPDAVMASGEPLLLAVVRYVKDLDQQFRYVAILLCEHADVNATDSGGKTALMYSCIYGYEKLAKSLLNHERTNLYQTDFDGNTAFMHAAANGRLNILKSYLKALRKVEKHTNKSGSTSMSKTQHHKDSGGSFQTACFETFLEMENREGLNASMLAVKHNHLDCVRLIEEARLKYLRENSGSGRLLQTDVGKRRANANLASAKYPFQAGGSCESLSTHVAIEESSGTEKANVSKRLLQFRHDAKFQSQQDLQRRRNSDIDLPIVAELCPGVKTKHPQHQQQTSDNLKHEEPTTMTGPKKTLIQGVMSIFKRRPRYNAMFQRSQLNHSVSTDVQPYAKNGQNRRKSVDVGLQAFHQFVEKPSLTDCPIFDEPLNEKET